MAKQDFSIPALMRRCGTEADAYMLLEELRWANGVSCPHCGSIAAHYFLKPANGTSRKTRTGSRSERRVWKCRDCRKQFSVLTGTIFHGTKISVRTWVLVVLEMCASKNGVAAREIERKYDLTPKTAWFMLHRIREAMKRDPLAGLLSGTVIADETWIGGDPKNQHAAKKLAKGSERWAKTQKPSVLSLVHKESGEVRSRVIPNVKGSTLRKAIEAETDIGATTLHTDSWGGYMPMRDSLKGHEMVNHTEGEYVRGDVTTNHAEGYFSQLKRSIDGTHHHISQEHLPRYLAQHDFLRSTYRMDDSDRMRTLVEQTGGRRLTYRPLTGE